jgi:hypothetical protein
LNWVELAQVFVMSALGGACGGYLFHRFNRRAHDALEQRAVVALERIARAHRLPGEP